MNGMQWEKKAIESGEIQTKDLGISSIYALANSAREFTQSESALDRCYLSYA